MVCVLQHRSRSVAHVRQQRLTNFYPPRSIGLILYARSAGYREPGEVPHLITGCTMQPVGPTGTSHSMTIHAFIIDPASINLNQAA